MVFDGEYFQQIFGLIMGTKVAPILTNIYMAMLENELKQKCNADPKLIWPVLFKRFIDDGFGIIKGVREDVIYWIGQFNKLRETVQIDKYNWGNSLDYMDLFIYKGDAFYTEGKLSVSIHQKETNKFMYIPYRSFHQRHTIKNYVWGELKRYVRYNTEEKNYKNLRLAFFLDSVTADSGNTSWLSYSNMSHIRKGMNYSILKCLFLMYVNHLHFRKQRG